MREYNKNELTYSPPECFGHMYESVAGVVELGFYTDDS